MGTKITDTEMTSTSTRHTATVNANGTWSVSWLPGRELSRNEAITAMTIAESVAANDLTDNSHWIWGHIDQWAAELGITGPHAVAEASVSPEERAEAEDDLNIARALIRAGKTPEEIIALGRRPETKSSWIRWGELMRDMEEK